MQNLSIKLRITIGIGLILLLAVLSTANSLWQNRSVKYESGEVSGSWIPAIDNLGRMKGDLGAHYLLVSNRVSGRDSREAAVFAQELETLSARLAKETEVYAATLLTYNEDSAEQGRQEKALYADYQTKRDAYLKLAQAALVALRGGADLDAAALAKSEFADKGYAAFEQAFGAMQAILDFNLKGTAEAADAVREKVARVEYATLAALAVMLLVGGALMVLVPRSVTAPVQEAVVLARRIAEGDLTHRLQTARGDELGELLRHLSAMQDQLAQVVSRVRQGSEGVATASAEISQGNHDLSARTEQQASALEQTAASMEELGSTVRHNADSARQASALAQQASQVATQGGQVVDQVVSTMKGIHAASQRIADIIGVVDGIAFQTNILALNAAVEAARAGEQGRGFAVVAGEVRSLAGRSAEAAREIKQLIQDSVERVAQGTTLADQAGQTMGQVVGAIGQVATLVGEISTASQEQSAGVVQVGEAVTHMDQSTQQNAALVEQMAAAASCLQGQAQELVGIVSTFKLDATRPA